MPLVNLAEVESFYQALRANAKSPKKLRSLERLWAALNEMVDRGVSLNVIPDVGQYLKEHYHGSPALSTITNDTDGMNELVKLAIQACRDAGRGTRKQARKKLTEREKLHETLMEKMTSEKSRALLEEVFRENDQLRKENKILRGAYANLTQRDIKNATLKLGEKHSLEKRELVKPLVTGLDLMERRRLKSLFDVLSRDFDITLDPNAGDLMHPALGYLGAEDAVSVLMKMLGD